MTLKQLRQWRGLTIEAAAFEIGVSAPTWSKIEMEQSTDYKSIIAQKFGVEVVIGLDGKTSYEFPNGQK